MIFVCLQNADAICLDGTQASYYTRLTGSNTWVFYVEDGGAFCLFDKEECHGLVETSPYFASSSDKYHPPTVKGYGPFSDDVNTNPWATANFIYISYCSSDAWLSNSLAPLGTYYTRGSIILKSVLDELLTNVTKSTSEVIFMGTSAGGIGVMNHVSHLTNTLEFPVSNVNLIVDSWYYSSIPSEPQNPVSSSVIK